MEIETSDKVLHIPSTASKLPVGWMWRRLDDVCEGIFDCPHSTPKLTSDGSYVARSQDIRSGVFRLEEAGRVSEETYSERIKRVEPRYGDLLYSREGTYFGIAAEVPKDIRVCLGQRMVLIRPEAKYVNFRFLRCWLNSPVLTAHIYGHRDGTVAERLNLPTIRGLPVPVAPLDEQKAIAHILGTLDDKIELNQQMNHTLESIARALFKSWFIDFDPVRAKLDGRQPAGMDAETAALFPDEFEDGGAIGQIPKGWEVGVMEDEFKITMGQSPPGSTYNQEADGLPFYQGCTDFGCRYPSVRVHCNAPTRFADLGDTLISVRAPVGSINMANERCCIGRGVAAARHKQGSRSYTYYTMHGLNEHFARFEAEGTVFGSMNKKDFLSIPCIIPPTVIISAFEQLAFPLDQRIESQEGQTVSLAFIRDALLPKLLSGEIRVKDAEKIVEAVT